MQFLYDSYNTAISETLAVTQSSPPFRTTSKSVSHAGVPQPSLQRMIATLGGTGSALFIVLIVVMTEHLAAFLALPPSPRPATTSASRTPVPVRTTVQAPLHGSDDNTKAVAATCMQQNANTADETQPKAKVVPGDKELRNMLELHKSQSPGIAFAALLKNVKVACPDWEFSTKRAKRILRTQVPKQDGPEAEQKGDGNTSGPAAAKTPSTSPRVAQNRPLFIGKVNGARPNLFWRAVTTADLREHPLFQALPDPWEVQVATPADLSLFQQDSPQWDALHDGRLTTSRCAPVLGIYEPLAAKTLGVPSSLSGHHKVMEAFHKLLRPPCDVAQLSSLTPGPDPAGSTRKKRAPVWREDTNGAFPFAYEPHPATAGLGREYTVETAGRARMVWGSTQEATSILAAVNLFAATGGTVREVGLCPLEAHPLPPALAHAPDGRLLDLPLMGASPDGVVEWPNGTIEAIEVKNHAPFREGGSTPKSRHRSKFYIHDPGPWSTVAPWHILQIQLEILCLGPKCRAANFMSCSATRGINVLRVPRDDAYILRLLRLVDAFQTKFIRTETLPPPDFAAQFPDYLKFLEETKRVAKSAKLVARIPAEAVQRSPLNRKFFNDKK